MFDEYADELFVEVLSDEWDFSEEEDSFTQYHSEEDLIVLDEASLPDELSLEDSDST